MDIDLKNYLSFLFYEARQTRFILSHQLYFLILCVGRQLFNISEWYIHLANLYGTTAIKSGCVIAWKVIMTVEAAGLRGSGH